MEYAALEQFSVVMLISATGMLGITIAVMVGIDATFKCLDFVQWLRS